MDYNPYGSYLYPPHPPPPPYYNQGQWQNPGRFEEATATQGTKTSTKGAIVPDTTTMAGTTHTTAIAIAIIAETMNEVPYRTQLEREQRQPRTTSGPAATIRELPSPPTAGPVDNNNRSIASSVHAPVGAPMISVTPTATSAHSGGGVSEFDDILYPTQEELFAAASLFNYGPADPIHPDFSWANDTGALIVTGETAQLIAQKGGPVLANHLTMRAERTLHLETVLGISRENSTLPARLSAHRQMAKEHQFAWSFRPNLTINGALRDTHDDDPIPHPHLANPSLDDPAETHALWLLVYGDPVNYPDLATVRAHLLLRRLLKGIRIVKKNFTSHFLDIATIPYFYGQKLTELDLVAEQHIDFKTSTSAFELLDEVVNHLAECGVSADDMGEAYYWGQQAVLDLMQKHDPGTKEYLRYQRLFKRAAARLQFTNTPIVVNRTWVLSSEWDMKDIIAEKRRRVVQYEYDQQKDSGKREQESEYEPNGSKY
ncbi:hypothetical protein F5880DRAFT_1511189 [Lentinula raphanica]|nr:hypothetical protein F5880DRAFT_1511189 [Lentinula raphanica]